MGDKNSLPWVKYICTEWCQIIPHLILLSSLPDVTLESRVETVGCLLVTVYRLVCEQWDVYWLLFTDLYDHSGIFTGYCLQACMSTVGCLLVTVYRLFCQQWDVY